MKKMVLCLLTAALILTAASCGTKTDKDGDKTAAATFTSYGSIPTCGVSVTDAVGDTVVFAIEISGMDGSLLLTEVGCR